MPLFLGAFVDHAHEDADADAEVEETSVSESLSKVLMQYALRDNEFVFKVVSDE